MAPAGKMVHGRIILSWVLKGFQSHSIQVYQIPRVDAVSGSSVTLQCQYTLRYISEADHGWFTWYRHIVNGEDCVSNTEGLFKGRVSKSNLNDFINKSSANIILHNVDITDTGLFICQVTFQLDETISGHGNGTFLNVTVRNKATTLRNLMLLRIYINYLHGGMLGRQE
ncbi:natural cytotoxicity triggering receptor 3-like [Pelobates fuscus]|uniref:natural cytotoxicity triggering receptor 3-like n=1 Tax=Pelobates fuscus TaxID=191477 RepID=UPI002FE44173